MNTKKSPAPAAAAAGTGLRELNKLDKQQRIKSAARALFSKSSYEAVTLREIARQARVAHPTLFLYADDKRDLVLMLFNEEITRLIEEASRTVRRRGEKRFVNRVLAFLGVFYTAASRNPTLYRAFFRELTFYYHGKHAKEFHLVRSHVLRSLEELVSAAQLSGQISALEDAGLIAQHIYFLHSAAIRWWIADERPRPSKGIDHLRQLLRLQINGLKPARKSRGA